MTVGAADVAFLDLDEHSTPRFVHGEDDDVVLLKTRIAMVEVQNDDVALSAVDARVSSKVLTDQWPVLGAIPIDPCDFLLDVRVAIADVVLASVLGVACATPALASASRLVVERERVNWFKAATVVAPLGRGLRR